MNEGFQNLANAVVRQAVLDYRAAYKRHLRHPHDAETRREVESLEGSSTAVTSVFLQPCRLTTY